MSRGSRRRRPPRPIEWSTAIRPRRVATRPGEGEGRSPGARYDWLDPEAIAALPVAERAAADALLLLRTADRALDVIRARGLTARPWASVG